MLIESINDEIAIAKIEKDIKAMSKAIASLKKHRLLVKKVKVAISSGRITEERGHELLSSLHSSISDDLYIIQERGLGLGQWGRRVGVPVGHVAGVQVMGDGLKAASVLVPVPQAHRVSL